MKNAKIIIVPIHYFADPDYWELEYDKGTDSVEMRVHPSMYFKAKELFEKQGIRS